MQKSIFGWIASSITLIYKLPQIFKLYKTKKSVDLSLFSLLIQCFGYIFYILLAIISISSYYVYGGWSLFETAIIVISIFIIKNIKPSYRQTIHKFYFLYIFQPLKIIWRYFTLSFLHNIFSLFHNIKT